MLFWPPFSMVGKQFIENNYAVMLMILIEPSHSASHPTP
jgi:hypothetical protein